MENRNLKKKAKQIKKLINNNKRLLYLSLLYPNRQTDGQDIYRIYHIEMNLYKSSPSLDIQLLKKKYISST